MILSTNFTTKSNTPERFIVWFRNETNLCVLWEPPYPTTFFDQYRVSIIPEDSTQSVLYMEKGTEPPVPAQAAFDGLIPGREYKISIQTVSESQLSDSKAGSYRTVPLPPTNVSFNFNTLSSYSFDVEWSPPMFVSEFDRYQVSLQIQTLPKSLSKNESTIARFSKDLEPGKTYSCGKVCVRQCRLMACDSITTRPLPVIDLISASGKLSGIYLEWTANYKSTQDSYMATYHEIETLNSTVQVMKDTHIHLSNLLPDRNHSMQENCCL